jgi:hypothetical protein
MHEWHAAAVVTHLCLTLDGCSDLHPRWASCRAVARARPKDGHRLHGHPVQGRRAHPAPAHQALGPRPAYRHRCRSLRGRRPHRGSPVLPPGRRPQALRARSRAAARTRCVRCEQDITARNAILRASGLRPCSRPQSPEAPSRAVRRLTRRGAPALPTRRITEGQGRPKSPGDRQPSGASDTGREPGARACASGLKGEALALRVGDDRMASRGGHHLVARRELGGELAPVPRAGRNVPGTAGDQELYAEGTSGPSHGGQRGGLRTVSMVGHRSSAGGGHLEGARSEGGISRRAVGRRRSGSVAGHRTDRGAVRANPFALGR